MHLVNLYPGVTFKGSVSGFRGDKGIIHPEQEVFKVEQMVAALILLILPRQLQFS